MELNGSWTMARKDETGVPEFLIPFQVDQSWYERYWCFHSSYPFGAAIGQASRRAG
jgi:hypothetical protein